MVPQLVLLAAADPNPKPELWRIITKMAYFAGLIAVTGVCMLHLLVLRPVLRRDSVAAPDREVLTRRTNLLLAMIGLWFLVALYFQLAGKAARVKGKELPYGEALKPSSIWTYVTTPGGKHDWIGSGAIFGTQFALWTVAALVLMALWLKRFRARTTLVALVVLVLDLVGQMITLVPPNPGGETTDSTVDALLDHLHVFAISTWVGGITGLVVLAAARRKLTPGAGATWAQIWTRFSTVALTAVGCILISGLWLAWKHVASPSELFTTDFGRFLLVKVSFVASMILVGAINEFVLMPRIARARAAGEEGSVFRLALRVFPGLVAVEVGLAVGVLFVLTFLTGSSRAEVPGDVQDPTISGAVVGTGAVLAVMLVLSFVATAKVSDRLSRAPQREESPVEEPASVA